jgi:hypothetical protein
MLRTDTVVPAVLFVAIASACAADQTRRDGSFDDVFPIVERVTFAEPAGDPITEITDVAVHPDGGFLIVDGPAMPSRARMPQNSGTF